MLMRRNDAIVDLGLFHSNRNNIRSAGSAGIAGIEGFVEYHNDNGLNALQH